MNNPTRAQLIRHIIEVNPEAAIIANLGLMSQELYNISDRPNHFYMLGSMGMATAIGYGVVQFTDKDVVVLEGDGSVAMSPNISGRIDLPPNLFLCIFINHQYETTGGQEAPDYYLPKDNRENGRIVPYWIKPHITPNLKPIPHSPQFIRDRFMEFLKGD